MLNEFNGLKIELYESIENCPMDRYSKFQRYAMIDSKIGASLDDFVYHLVKAKKLIRAEQKNEAEAQLTNAIECVQLIFAEHQPIHRAYASIIKSINGKEVTDISERGLDDIIVKLNKASVSHSAVKTAVDYIKKNLNRSLNYFSLRWPGMAK